MGKILNLSVSYCLCIFPFYSSFNYTECSCCYFSNSSFQVNPLKFVIFSADFSEIVFYTSSELQAKLAGVTITLVK